MDLHYYIGYYMTYQLLGTPENKIIEEQKIEEPEVESDSKQSVFMRFKTIACDSFAHKHRNPINVTGLLSKIKSLRGK